MADRIVISTEWLNRCMTELRQVQNALSEANSRLNQVDLRREAGGAKSITFRTLNLNCGARISGDEVREVARSIGRGVDTSNSDIAELVKGLTSSIAMFNDIEKRTLGLINGVTDPSGDSTVYNGASAFISDWSSVFQDCRKRFEEIRQRLIEEQKRWEESRKKTEELRRQAIEEINRRHVFEDDYEDRNILYGGEQHGAMNDRAGYDDYRDIIYENTGKRLTDEQLETYLNRMNSEGCGYMAMTNAILLRYQGRAEDFERDFGFPMYKNGELNYNELMVDIYSTTDNHSRGIFGGDSYDAKEDKELDDGLFGYDLYSDSDGRGTDKTTLEYRLEMYMNEHGVEGDVKAYSRNKITVENYAEKAADGPIMISVGKPYTLRNADGTVYRTSKGGHCMMITGVEDGKFVVSSWGDKYLIDPDDNFGFMNFHQVMNA